MMLSSLIVGVLALGLNVASAEPQGKPMQVWEVTAPLKKAYNNYNSEDVYYIGSSKVTENGKTTTAECYAFVSEPGGGRRPFVPGTRFVMEKVHEPNSQNERTPQDPSYTTYMHYTLGMLDPDGSVQADKYHGHCYANGAFKESMRKLANNWTEVLGAAKVKPSDAKSRVVPVAPDKSARCEEVTEEYAICQQRRYERTRASVYDKSNAVKKALDAAGTEGPSDAASGVAKEK